MIEQITRTTLSKSVLERLIHEIKQGTWQLGSRIPNEKDLAETFSVSRNCIREALKMLNNMGIVVSKPGKGTFLAEDATKHISNSELIEKGYKNATLQELTEIRILLESQSVYWAAVRSTEEDILKLKEILRQSQECFNCSMEDLDKLHFLFHETIINLSKNNFMKRLLASLHSEIETSRIGYENVPHVEQVNLIKDQEEIIHYILNREPEKARLAMKHHLEKGLSLISNSTG